MFPTWPIYLIGLVYPWWLFYLGLTGGLGIEPTKKLEHRYGDLALQTLIATLAITPLRRLTGIALIKFRRALGLLAFYFVCLHFLVWLVLDVQILAQIWADIVKRPYVTVGFAGFLLLIPVAITSNNYSIRRLGPMRWKRLHQISYVAAILGGLHFIWLSRGFQIEPLAYMASIVILLLLRIKLPRTGSK
jgi:sulfoxide reductase heme-binding subunit YedZ